MVCKSIPILIDIILLLIMEGFVQIKTKKNSIDKKTFCIYEATSPEAIRKAVKKNNTPVDKITEISVLNPYFHINK